MSDKQHVSGKMTSQSQLKRINDGKYTFNFWTRNPKSSYCYYYDNFRKSGYDDMMTNKN